MTLKQKALLQTVGIVLVIVAMSLLMNLVLFYTPVEVLKYAAGIALAGFVFYGIYGVVLSRLQYDETVKSITSKS
jgi:cytochrome c-type biogenesis protein CcmE